MVWSARNCCAVARFGFESLPPCHMKQADSLQGDVGRLLCRNVPSHHHHTHGDAQDPAAGCWQTW